MIGPVADTGVCEARSETALPCGRPAATSILGVSLCERCAREQEAYFALGEITEAPRGRRAGTTSAGNAAMAHRLGVARWVPARLRRRLRETVTASVKVSFLVVAASASILASAACGGAEQARGGSVAAAEPKVEPGASVQERGRAAGAGAEGNATDGTVARAGEARTGGGGAVVRAGDGTAVARVSDAGDRPGSIVVAQNGGEDAEGNAGGEVEGEVEGETGPRNVTLGIKGDQGTGFSGVCSVGGREKTLDGRAPERFDFEVGGKGIECEIRKRGEGTLEVVVTAGEGVRSVQRIGGPEGTVRFALSNGGVSSSISSVSVNQTAAFPGRS